MTPRYWNNITKFSLVVIIIWRPTYTHIHLFKIFQSSTESYSVYSISFYVVGLLKHLYCFFMLLGSKTTIKFKTALYWDVLENKPNYVFNDKYFDKIVDKRWKALFKKSFVETFNGRFSPLDVRINEHSRVQNWTWDRSWNISPR